MNDDVVKAGAGRRPLQMEWNATAADYPREMCVQERFEAQVWSKTPEGLLGELCVKILKLAVCLSSVSEYHACSGEEKAISCQA